MEPKKENKHVPPSHADALALAGVAFVGYGLALAWPPLCYCWLGTCLMTAAYFRARIRANAIARARSAEPPGTE